LSGLLKGPSSLLDISFNGLCIILADLYVDECIFIIGISGIVILIGELNNKFGYWYNLIGIIEHGLRGVFILFCKLKVIAGGGEGIAGTDRCC
jgi:hypothetical protein